MMIRTHELGGFPPLSMPVFSYYYGPELGSSSHRPFINNCGIWRSSLLVREGRPLEFRVTINEPKTTTLLNFYNNTLMKSAFLENDWLLTRITALTYDMGSNSTSSYKFEIHIFPAVKVNEYEYVCLYIQKGPRI